MEHDVRLVLVEYTCDAERVTDIRELEVEPHVAGSERTLQTEQRMLVMIEQDQTFGSGGEEPLGQRRAEAAGRARDQDTPTAYNVGRLAQVAAELRTTQQQISRWWTWLVQLRTIRILPSASRMSTASSLLA